MGRGRPRKQEAGEKSCREGDIGSVFVDSMHDQSSRLFVEADRETKRQPSGFVPGFD
jgi:hypothetical protein